MAPVVELEIDGGWVDVSNQTLNQQRVTITRRAGWQAVNSTVEPASCEFVLKNLPDAVTGVGPWSYLHPYATYYGKLRFGTPVRVTVDGSVRFHGEVADLRPSGDKTQRDGWVEVIARGALGRRSVGQQPLASPAYTALTAPENDATRLEYWPLEEESRAEAVTSPTGSRPIQAVGEVNFGASSEAPSTARMVTFGPDGQLNATVRPYTSTGEVKVCSVWHVPTEFPDGSLLMRIYFEGGTVDYFDVRYNTTGILRGDWYVANFNVDLAPNILINHVSGQHFFLSVEFAQDGADIDIRFLVVADTTTGSTGTDTTTGQTLGRIRHITVAQTELDGVSFGQLIVGNDTGAFPNFISPTAGGGLGTLAYRGEPGLRRCIRLADENGMAVDYRTREAVSMRLGDQTTDTLLEQFAAAMNSEGGMLFDDRDALGAKLVKSTRLLNLVPALVLDCDQKHVADPPFPADRDTLTRNDVAVSRNGGGNARQVIADDDPYHHTTQDPPDGIGTYADSYSLSLYQDRMCSPAAGWWAHIGSHKSPRIEAIRAQLHDTRMASLATDCLAVDIGDCIQIDNPPTWCGPGPARAIVHGYTEIAETVTHEITWDVAPADPWEVWILDSAGSTLAVAVDTDDTSLKLATSLGPQWATNTEPFHISVDGEAMTVTTLTTDTPAFIAAGVVSHANNASVTPALPAGITADVGQSLYIWVAIRNTAATVNTPSGWTALVDLTHAKLLHRYYVTGVTAPTITVSGGAGGDDVSGQMAAFSGLSKEFASGTRPTPAAATQSNASAQDIAYPAVEVQRAGGVVLYLGWKQDDWTSVTSPGDAEIGEPDTTTGSDQGIVWSYDIYTTATDVTAGSFTVTGGASAVSKGITVAFRPLQTATVTRSVNDIVASHAAAAEVHAWRPGAIAL